MWVRRCPIVLTSMMTGTSVLTMKRTASVVAAALSVATLVSGCGAIRENKPAGSARSSEGPVYHAEPSPSKAESSPQPFNNSGVLGGNAKPTFPDGKPGELTVVATGSLRKPGIGATLLVAFRNNTDEAVGAVELNGTARVDGKIVATGSSQGTAPERVESGEVSLAYIYFRIGENIPQTGVDYEFSAESSPARSGFLRSADLKVDEITNTGRAIVGSAINATGKTLDGPFSVGIYCFDGNYIADQTMSFTEEGGGIKADASVHFSVNLYDKPCESFIVGVSGYFS